MGDRDGKTITTDLRFPVEFGSNYRLKNPGKSKFLQMAAVAFREMNNQRDINVIIYTRKESGLCGLFLKHNYPKNFR